MCADGGGSRSRGLDTPQVWLSEERAVSLTDAPLLDFCPGTRFARPEKSS